ncbi:MAG: IPT/TIG domain-containing protein [Prevotella sp.]|nr:IPT/TIG domain-containing protein [Prevotella sp.]
MRRYKNIFLTLLAIVLLTACDKESMNSMVQSAPEIEAFYPESGSVGTEIVITGNYLDDVVSATIGGVPAELLQKVSNSQISIKVPAGAQSGTIVLANAIGKVESEGIFTMEYPAPIINLSSIPAEMKMGNKLLVSGTNMNVISSVIFTPEGMEEGSEAEIISQSDNEIVVKIPFLDSENATISFTYFDGSNNASVVSETVRLVSDLPRVFTEFTGTYAVGSAAVLEGINLNLVEKVYVVTGKGTQIECSINNATSSALVFTVPGSNDFDQTLDAPNTTTLKIVYADGSVESTLTDNFVIVYLEQIMASLIFPDEDLAPLITGASSAVTEDPWTGGTQTGSIGLKLVGGYGSTGGRNVYDQNGTLYHKLGSNSAYIRMGAADGYGPIKAGDVLTVVVWCNTGSAEQGLSLGTGTEASIANATIVIPAEKAEHTLVYTLTDSDIADNGSIYIYRQSGKSNFGVKSLSVKRSK